MDRPIIITECHLIDGNDLIMQLISHQVHAAKYNVIFGNAYRSQASARSRFSLISEYNVNGTHAVGAVS